jgi:hypothetical protein
MRWKFLAIVLGVVVAASSHSHTFGAQAQKPAGEIEKLAAFLGHWNASGEVKGSDSGKGSMKINSEITCNWAANHGFLICDQIIHLPDGDRNDLSIYTYSEKDHAFAFFGITRGSKEARTTKLTIEGNVWTYSSSETDGGKQTEYRTTNRFTSTSNLIWRAEYSQDGEHWTTTAEGSDVRVH